MQFKNIPNKYLRKAVFDALSGAMVNGEPIQVYDARVPVETAPPLYVLMDSQSFTPAKSKCQYDWTASFRLEVINQVPIAGNPGSRVLINDASDLVVAIFNTPIALDPGSGLKVISQNVDGGSDDVLTLDNVRIYRQPLICTFYVV